MVNISDRWNRDKNQRSAICLIQRSWLGELGKIFGESERNHAPDAEATRRVAPSNAPLLLPRESRLGADVSDAWHGIFAGGAAQ